MKAPRLSLQARFHFAILLLLVLMVAVMLLFWQRQQQHQHEVVDVAAQSMHRLLGAQVRAGGESEVRKLADALTNPVYYFDLDAIGTQARAALREADVLYVLVYDGNGRILHDGSGDIATYGQPMSDPLAARVIAGTGLQAHVVGETLDVSEPIRIGDERLGGVRIGYSLTAMQRAEAQALEGLRANIDAVGTRTLGWLLAFCVALAALAAAAVLVVQRQLLKPIKSLGDAARAIEQGDFSGAALRSNRQDELGDLVRTFTRMRESVARHDRDIRRVAYSDALTGLSNRLAFREGLEERLRAAQGTGRQLALLFADLDDFKRVNDSLGHEAGDEVLLQVATRIATAVEAVPDADIVVARFGGDEFVISLENALDAPLRDLRQLGLGLASDLVKALAAPIQMQGKTVALGVSIGVAMYPDDADTTSKLMKCGDIAMYQAKMAGKNCYRLYNRAMTQAVEDRIRMEHDLRDAWDRGELSLVYQPVFRTSDRALMGAEALLRWNHPTHGLVAPSVFIDVAEQTGMIEGIGLDVLQSACLEAAGWEVAAGSDAPPFIAVNVSARQLRHGALVGQVEAALAAAGLAATRLHLELTETAVISDEANASAVLAQLRQAGVKVWLDDFGTGYSSLSHLRRVQVDGLKIDRSFITDLLVDPDDLALTSAIVAMGRSMGVTVVAEGVEREGQFELLRERRCDMVQGFWLGEPMSAFEFRRLLAG